MSLQRCTSLTFVLVLSTPLLAAQEGYRLPPPEVVEIADAAPAPRVSSSPDGKWMLLVERASLPSIAEVARPMLRLAGLRIDPAARAPYRTSFDRGLSLRPLTGGEAQRIPLPAGARLDRVLWSHDSRHFAFTLAGEEGTHLYAVDVEAPGEPRLLSKRLNTILVGPRWMPDGRTLLCSLVPEAQGPAPEAPAAPAGPNTQETSGDTSPLRTYQDLLQDPHDEALFEHYATSQTALIGVDGEQRLLGPAGILSDLEPDPDGQRLLVTEVRRPFSYLMPYYQFGQRVSVWKLAGGLIQRIADIPPAENVPLGGVRLGPRSIGWHAHRPGTLVWCEALDGGDPEREVPARDRWMTWGAPFKGDPAELLRVEHRARGLSYLEDSQLLISSEYDRERRWSRVLLHDLSRPAAEPRVLEDRSRRDRYADPGRLVTRTDARGRDLVRLDGEWMYRAGGGVSPEGVLPFLDRQNVRTLESERLWRCAPGAYESVSEVFEPEASQGLAFLTRRETPSSPSNLFLRRVGADEPLALTDFPDPSPWLRGVHKEVVTYERADGVSLHATLYLPPDHEQGQRLPLLVWAYPIEFRDPEVAGQVSASPWRFTRVEGLSHLVLLSQGYAILDGATMPIVGDPETMNDTFVEQIVGAASAAIDFAVERGFADRERVVVGGHSYGAFMTANLLAHCDLFAAGVARSGAYNRTLTPFGFQSERRTFWEAPEAYFAVSPFMHADEIDEPLLMIHGEIDNNSGTFPLQSQRLFQAIKGNGGTARLVMLPHESHGYRARESVLHVHAETIEWFARFAGARQ